MKAVVMTAIGEPEVLVLQDIPDPEAPRDREVLVKLKAASINPADMKMRRGGTLRPGNGPIVLGFDGAGVIEAVGPEVESFKVGDHVYFCAEGLGARPGTYSEYVTIDERFIARKPVALTFIEAAAAPLVCITAWEALFDRVQLQAGQTILIHAGASGVGHVAIQLAKLTQSRIITTVGSIQSAEYVRSLGVDHVVLYKQSDFVKSVLGWTNGQGVDVAFDTVGGETLSKSFQATKFYGKVVGIVEANWGDIDFTTHRQRVQSWHPELMLSPMLYNLDDARQHQAHILAQCALLFNRQQLRIQVSKTFPLAHTAEAHRALEKGSLGGKIVLTI